MRKLNEAPLPGALRRLGVERRFESGERLFAEGQPARGFYYVLEGAVRVYRADEKGREVDVARFGRGDYLGEVVLFAMEEFPVNAECAGAVRVLYLDKRRLLSEIRRSPEAALFFLRLLAKKCLILNRRVEALGLWSVRRRLIHYVAARCPETGAHSFDLDLKKQQLARQLGTAGETLSRNLRQLQKEGLIRVRGRRIQVPDAARLRAKIFS